MASLEGRLAALEQKAGTPGKRLRLVQLRDGETETQAFERLGAGASVANTIFVTYVSPDPARVAKLEAGITPAEMTTAELLLARSAIEGPGPVEVSHGAES